MCSVAAVVMCAHADSCCVGVYDCMMMMMMIMMMMMMCVCVCVVYDCLCVWVYLCMCLHVHEASCVVLLADTDFVLAVFNCD